MKVLYLEPDEEITSVIDRLRTLEDEEVTIVAPKRAGLLQSIINLKLLKHQGEQLGKKLSLVTTDKTGRNLASAVGLTVYQRLPEEGDIKEAAVKERGGQPVPIGFRKHRPPEDSASTGSVPIGYKPGKQPEMAKRSIASSEQEAAPEAPEQPSPEPAEPVSPEVTPPAKTSRPSLPKISLPHPSLPSVRLPKPSLPKWKLPRKRWITAVAVALIVLLGGGVAAAAVLPKATITVTPATDPFKTDVPVTFAARAVAPDFAANVLPAKVIDVTRQSSKQVNATGTKEAGGKATGTISVINTLSRTQSLVARTRFAAPDGRIYRTQSAVRVPANGQASVTVTADDAGEAGNLAAGTRMTIPALSGEGVYGQTSAEIAGGTNSATPVVSAADADRARNELAVQAAQEGLDEAKAKLAVGNKINDKVTVTTVLDSDINPPVGAPGTAFTITGRVKIAYFTYSDSDYQQMLKEDLGPKVPPGSDLVTDKMTQVFTTGQASSDRLAGIVTVSAFTSAGVSRDELKQQITGLTPDEAEQRLRELGKVSNVSVKLSPFWVRKIPERENKVHIEFATGTPVPQLSPSPGPQVVTPAL